MYRIDLTNAINIAADFGDLLVSQEIVYEYEDILPYPKDEILLALITILKTDNKEMRDLLSKSEEEIKDYKEHIATIIMTLDGFIPKKEEYKKRVNVLEYTKTRLNKL